MKIIFANDSLAKLRYLTLSENEGSGFLKAERIGHYVFITDLIVGNIFESSDVVNVYEMWGCKFGGIFVSKELENVSEIFLEKLVLTLRNEKYSIVHFDSDFKSRILIQEGSLNKN